MRRGTEGSDHGRPGMNLTDEARGGGSSRRTSPGLDAAMDPRRLADLASETMGIPGRQALRLADEYVREGLIEPDFLSWIVHPTA